MLSENYKCDGQISLIDYMAELEEETIIVTKELPAEQKSWKINKKDAEDKEMEELAEQYGDERRTTLESPEDVPVELPDSTPVPEDAVVVFTENGYLKRILPAQLKRTPLPAPPKGPSPVRL